MTYPTTIKGQRVVLQLGDGATPTEAFTIVCGITSKGLQRTRKTNDSEVWDCTDPEALPIIERDAGASDWTISGSGQAVATVLDSLEAAYESAVSSNWKLVFLDSSGAATRTYSGAAYITDLSITANNGSKAEISISLSGDGALTQT